MNQHYLTRKPFLKTAMSVLFILITCTIFSVSANESILLKAEQALNNNQHQLSSKLYLQLSKNDKYKIIAYHGLAKVAFQSGDFKSAANYIEKALEMQENNSDLLFTAGRIAGKQAQNASIFTKLGYASDARKYFTKALEINPQHQDSLIGLIRFHQQAPVMAGGDKQLVAIYINKLRSLDNRSAFSIEAPILLDKNDLTTVMKLYKQSLISPSTKSIHQFKFDSAMLFSAYGHYQQALNEILSIDMSNDQETSEFVHMRLYQLGKLTAETKTQLELGFKSMQQYSNLAAKDKTISEDWIKFRLAQISFLRGHSLDSKSKFLKLKSLTNDDSLKTKIQSVLNEIKG
jgi:tetratricopeptide (TPR) repeat protein